MNFEDDGDHPIPANLVTADDGYRLCDTCSGEGVVMDVVSGPNGPIFFDNYCDNCGGDGQVEVDEGDAASPDANSSPAAA